MNSINERIARLQKKMYPQPKTKRQLWLQDKIKEFMLKQNGRCICGYQWEGLDKPVIDFTDNTNAKVRGLICEPCSLIERGSRGNPNYLRIFADYMEGNSSQTLEDDWRKK